MNLHGYLAREGIAYGSPEGLDFTNLYFYTITWHALHTSMMLARERNQRFAGFEQSRYASGEYFSQYLEGDWQPKTARVRELFARAGIVLPTREMWQQLRDDVMRYGIYNQNLQACRQPALSPTSTTPRRAFTRSCRRLKFAKKAKPDAFTTLPRL
jgi:ribonucleoside-diphosphate reductase alpha chain